MKKVFVIFYILCIVFSKQTLNAQNEANIWYFGKNAGLDFNSGVPVPLNDGQLITHEGCATISDVNGQLLFYTDGVKVWNKNHQIMMNGTGLLGDFSSTQSALIVPNPALSNIFYIFCVDFEGNADGVTYSEVDMNLDSGLGGITATKNIQLITPSTEKVTAVKHANGTDFWVVTHGYGAPIANQFFSYLVTATGVNTTPVISSIGDNVQGFYTCTLGAMKISPDGSKLAVVHNSPTDKIEILDFDTNTGTLSNPYSMSFAGPGAGYGIEFSPSGNLIYVTETGSNFMGVLYQYNLNAPDIEASRLIIAYTPDKSIGQLQLAVDGKIYLPGIQVTPVTHIQYDFHYISVIENPNALGTACNFQLNSVSIGNGSAKLGLPPFIQSYFNVSIQTQGTCLGNLTQFNINTNNVDSVNWDFGDPASGLNNTSTTLEPTHLFSATGTYTVTLTAISGTETDVSTVEVEIFEVPQAYTPTTLSLCDTQTPFNDGIGTFDLSTVSALVLGGQSPSQFQVLYYHTYNDAVNNSNLIQIPTTYTNANSAYIETIYAKVVNVNNQSCYAISSFSIHVFDVPQPTLPGNILICDSDHNNTELVDLSSLNNTIINGQSNVNLSYHNSQSQAENDTNPLATTITTASTIVWIRLENALHPECYSINQFQIEVFAQPIAYQPTDLTICDTDYNGLELFDFNTNIPLALNGQTGMTVSFHTSQIQAENDTNALPLNYMSGTDIIWVRVENDLHPDCYDITNFSIAVYNTPEIVFNTHHLYTCDTYESGSEIDGLSTFDLTSNESYLINGFDANLFTFEYFTDANFTDPISDPTHFQNEIAFQQEIFIKVFNTLSPNCAVTTSFFIIVNALPEIETDYFVYYQCDTDGTEDGITTFDLNEIIPYLITETTGIEISFFTSYEAALLNYMPLNSSIITNSLYPPFVYIKFTNLNGCFKIVWINMKVTSTNIPSDFLYTFETCDNDTNGTDGVNQFDLTQVGNDLLDLFPSNNDLVITYYHSESDALLEQNPISNPSFYSNVNPFHENLYVRLEHDDNGACFGIGSNIEIIVYPKPEFEIPNEVALCFNHIPLMLEVQNPTDSNLTYYWRDDENHLIGQQNTLELYHTGTYFVSALSISGCESSIHQVHVTASELAQMEQIEIEITSENGFNTVYVNMIDNPLGIGNYVFALDDINGAYQSQSIFYGVDSGMHFLYVKDINECGIVPITFYILGIPNFFTPNGDGFNDFWQIKGLDIEKYRSIEIDIFDRFGKHISRLDPNGQGWDGTCEGRMLFSSDYWFKISMEEYDGNLVEKRGYFSLIR